MTGQGGWPMSVFLTPDGQPFYGGTYYPPEPRYGMPSFRQVLAGRRPTPIAQRRDQVDQQAQNLTDMLQPHRRAGEPEQRSRRGYAGRGASSSLAQHFDDEHGGFGSQPKFPQPMNLDFHPHPVSAHGRVGHALHGRAHAGTDGAGRHLRPVGRRLPPLQRGRGLAGAPLREDALRQRPVAAHLSARLADHAAPALPPHRRGDDRLRAARDDRARRRLLQHAGRRQRGRGGQVLCVDAGGDRGAARRADSGRL